MVDLGVIARVADSFIKITEEEEKDAHAFYIEFVLRCFV